MSHIQVPLNELQAPHSFTRRRLQVSCEVPRCDTDEMILDELRCRGLGCVGLVGGCCWWC